MSITANFEARLLPIEHSTVYGKDEVEALLEHARVLETVLKELETSGYRQVWGETDSGYCPICGKEPRYEKHSPDCRLGKLLAGGGMMDEQRAQDLVRQAMEREYVRDPSDPEDMTAPEFCPVLGRPYLDGRFYADELEAIAWCIRNDKWPTR